MRDPGPDGNGKITGIAFSDALVKSSAFVISGGLPRIDQVPGNPQNNKQSFLPNLIALFYILFYWLHFLLTVSLYLIKAV